MKMGLEEHQNSIDHRRNILRNFSGLGVDATHLPDPEELIREDRDGQKERTFNDHKTI